MNILLGITGSVAAIKANELYSGLSTLGEVKVVATPSALRFFDKEQMPVSVYTEEEEWAWRKVGDEVLHIELRNWFDVLVIAPLSANSLAKMAQGLCDNLLLSIWLASNKKKTVIAPAMNTAMWEHPMTQRNLRELVTAFPESLVIVPPVEKRLACGDVGIGALAAVSSIVAEVARQLKTTG